MYNSDKPVKFSKNFGDSNALNKNSLPHFLYSSKTTSEHAIQLLNLSVAGKTLENVERKPLIECGIIPRRHSFEVSMSGISFVVL